MIDYFVGENGELLRAALYSTILFQILETAWNIYVSYRQRSVILNQTEHVPYVLAGVITPETFRKSRAYSLDCINFTLVRTTVMSLLVCPLEIYGCLLAHQWEWARWLCREYDLPTNSETFHTVVFLEIFCLHNYVKNLPWKCYRTFCIEQRHGFNQQTAAFFVLDQLKTLLVAHVFALPIACAVVQIVRASGSSMVVWLWLFAVIVMLGAVLVYPAYVAPLFDRYSELPKGELRTDIEALADRLDFPLTKLLVVEGSRRSAHSNAYFFGLWNSKQIVLYDTLFANYDVTDDATQLPTTMGKRMGCCNDEVVAVLAHELGHWHRQHVLKNLAVGQAQMLVLFWLFGQMFDQRLVFQTFGFDGDERPVVIGLILLSSYILSAYSFVVDFASMALSRRFEYEADEFAVRQGYAEPLARALVKLNGDNLGYPVYDWLYSAYNHSHPPLLQRLARIEQVAQKQRKIR